jgi:uncharacterized protein with PIN domain
MLGKLAKWLRLLGCDVLYFHRMPDEDLVEQAFRSGRTILTRDTRLIKRSKARNNHFFVQGDGCRDQLRLVVEHFSIRPLDRIFTRCLRCNESLSDIEKSAVRKRVPPYVHETQKTFRTCRCCGRVYWNGTHRDEMARQVQEMFGPRKRPDGSEQPS